MVLIDDKMRRLPDKHTLFGLACPLNAPSTDVVEIITKTKRRLTANK
jgi:hypothetical protein